MESTHDFVLERLEASKGEWREIAKDSGVPFGTVKRIGYGYTSHPRIDSVEKLARYFRAKRKRA